MRGKNRIEIEKIYYDIINEKERERERGGDATDDSDGNCDVGSARWRVLVVVDTA